MLSFLLSIFIGVSIVVATLLLIILGYGLGRLLWEELKNL